MSEFIRHKPEKIASLPHQCFYDAMDEILPTGATFAELGRLYGVSRQEAEVIFETAFSLAKPKLAAGLKSVSTEQVFIEDVHSDGSIAVDLHYAVAAADSMESDIIDGC